jgi:hypothetical protein
MRMVDVMVIDEIPVYVPHSSIDGYPHLEGIECPVGVSVDVLIGQDHANALIPLDVRKGKIGDPFATRTLFGWSLNGPTNASNTSSRVIANFISTTKPETQIDELRNMKRESHLPLKNNLPVCYNEAVSVEPTECDDLLQHPVMKNNTSSVPTRNYQHHHSNITDLNAMYTHVQVPNDDSDALQHLHDDDTIFHHHINSKPQRMHSSSNAEVNRDNLVDDPTFNTQHHSVTLDINAKTHPTDILYKPYAGWYEFDDSGGRTEGVMLCHELDHQCVYHPIICERCSECISLTRPRNMFQARNQPEYIVECVSPMNLSN